MIRFVIFSLSLIFVQLSYAQNKTIERSIINIKYKKVEIPFTSNDIFSQIAKLGIDVHCGVSVTDLQNSKIITLEVSEIEYKSLQSAGLNPNIVIDDLSDYYAKRNIKELPVAKKQLTKMKAKALRYKKLAQDMGCEEDSYPVPQNFELGSMGGFTTYQEMLDELDQMRSLYPNLISQRIPASTTETTIEGRTVYYVRLSDNPDADESEPEVLYNGVHHAREPLSMMNLLYYMWYLLENYDTDPSIKNIVDNVEMYFIPVVNPDGYIYNQTTNPNGGGLWRKNRRINGGGSVGVDLNRNYGYNWGYDNTGSSGNTNSDIYRGPSPFSEPESRIMRDFTYERKFINVFNNHSYSNLLLHPWGYTSGDCPDEELFDEISEQMCWHNRYHYGNSRVIYQANGDANDWHYGEQTVKRKILAWTPEIGSLAEGGFWPSPGDIVPQCERQMHMSLILAQSAANFGILNDLTPYGIDNQNTALTFSVEHMSLVPGSFTVTISSSDPNVVSIANPVMTTGIMTDSNYETISTNVTLANGIASGTPVSFDVIVNNGAYDIYSTTITKVFQPVELFSDNGASLNNWSSSGGWGVSNSTGYNSGSSITDSPSGNMSRTLRTLSLSTPIDLSGSQNPVLEYYTKWDIYRLFDYVQIQASTNGNNWEELCGEYTKIGASPDNVFSGNGSPDQPTGDGLYDGYQKEWLREQIDLSDYAGINTLYLRFIAKGDTEVTQRDGIYIDDFTVYREPLGHCENGVQDADETGIDCGGSDCVSCPTCLDGIQNGNETGTDCGGNCEFCPQEICQAYNFNVDPVVNFDPGQDFGPYIIQDNGATVYMEGNAWKAVEINYPVTPNTMLEFDFKSTVEGEIHEVAFDNDLSFAPIHRAVVYGNQGYAGSLTNATYNGSGNWQSFAIPIGNQFTGTFQYLVLTADDDANAAGNSYFRYLKIYEDDDGDQQCENCAISIVESAMPPITYSKSASDYIQTNGIIINTGTVVKYNAGNYIQLNNGFSTINAEFKAYIEICR